MASVNDDIHHVVLLMLENRSFDQMLGCFKAPFGDLDGVDPDGLRENADSEGAKYRQRPFSRRVVRLDPHHEVEHVREQLADGNAGFVRNLQRNYPASTADDRQAIMDYFPLGSLPALHALAKNFLICDRWFSSLPGPTWPNRFFALTGTSSGHFDMPHDGTHNLDVQGFLEQDQDTIFDRLNEMRVPWRVYYHDIPASWVLLHQRREENVARYREFDKYKADIETSAEADFPAFTFIEPDYQGTNQNDCHPPHDVLRADALIAAVYNPLRARPDLWHTTLLVILFDEHGGFYDHVPPPTAEAPDSASAATPGVFSRLGVRVPAVLVSPWVERRVSNTQYDHTSLLKYLIERWELRGLGKRTASAASIGGELRALSKPRDEGELLPTITATPPALSTEDQLIAQGLQNYANSKHEMLALLGQYLKEEAEEEASQTIPCLCAALRELEKCLAAKGSSRFFLAQIAARLLRWLTRPDTLKAYADIEQRIHDGFRPRRKSLLGRKT